MNKCIDELLALARQNRTPLLFEVVKSIAALCNVDPYELWYTIAYGTARTASTTSATTTTSIRTQVQRTGPCWRCPACGKEFNDVRTLVNHILFYVRQRDRAHLEVYRKIKQKADQTGQTFTTVAMNELKC